VYLILILSVTVAITFSLMAQVRVYKLPVVFVQTVNSFSFVTFNGVRFGSQPNLFVFSTS